LSEKRSWRQKVPPFDHQRQLFEATKELAAYALFWEQGAAKTKPTIDTGTDLFLNDKIDAMLVVAPPGVHINWITDELPTHLSEDVAGRTSMEYFSTGKSGTKWHKTAMDRLLRHEGFAILTISYNGLKSQEGIKLVRKFLEKRRCLYVLDESHHIKAPGAKRTKTIVASGTHAPYRRILSGTYCPEGPFDVYSQIKFLDAGFWVRHGICTFAEFKTFFGVWKTAAEVKRESGYDPGYDQLLNYRNLDLLQEWLRPISNRVLKEDVLDLPAKIYMPRRTFELTTEQRRMYDQLAEEFYTELDGVVINADLAITRLLRFQQIACGYIKSDIDEPEMIIPGGNPRLDIMEEIRDSVLEKTIVWARFRKDIDQICSLLGNRVARYDGACSEDECARAKLDFQKGDAQWFVATQAKGKEGLTLTQAHHVVYFSNTFKLLDRLQTEDRPHRAGLTHSVDYTDLVAMGTVDEKIVRALRQKMDVAAQITGDKLREWI
jgi:SNF2 family DNA or RNA helicase